MIEEIFNGKVDILNRLDNIIQWQEIDTLNKESVSQHSYKVSVFTRILLEELFEANISREVLMFKLDALTLAMTHDWDEAIIRRDLSHEFKYNSFNGGDVRQVVDDYVNHSISNIFPESDPVSNIFIKAFNPNSLVKNFVKVSDWLSLLFYVKREIKLGNSNFSDDNRYYSTYCARRAENKFDEFMCELALPVKQENVQKIFSFLKNLQNEQI